MIRSIARRLEAVGRRLVRFIRIVAAPFGAMAGFVHVAAPAAGVAPDDQDPEQDRRDPGR